MKKNLVAVIMGSDSDFSKMKGAVDILNELGVSNHVEVVSAHRTPTKMLNFAKKASKNGYEVIIAGAGGAAHLPGMVASATHLPVIGVPVETGKAKGIDALFSIAQMPTGVPVATMAIDNSTNAGLLAARILAIKHPKIKAQIVKYQKKMKQKVIKGNKKIKELL